MPRELFAAAGAFVAALTCIPSMAAPIIGQGTWETTLQARDLTGDGVADAYFDTELNVTWLANANTAGPLTWSTATAWAEGLKLGVAGWRLPRGFNRCAPTNQFLSDCRFHPPATSANEMAHMYFLTLGNPGAPSWPYGLTNTGPFTGLMMDEYWTATFFDGGGTSVPDSASVFYTREGSAYWSPVVFGRPLYAWAVHDGDVGAVVPEPESLPLVAVVATVLTALAGRRSRRHSLNGSTKSGT